MHNAAPSSIRRALSGSALLLAGAVALAACSQAGATTAPPQAAAATTPPAASMEASMAATMAPGTAAPTPLQLMSFDFLPKADVPKDVKVSCEDAAGATLSCEDAVALAARIGITTSGGAPIQQVLVERDAANANVVTLTLWANDAETGELTAFTTTLDVAARTLSFPAENPDAVFPA
jgi:hypothetical protein